MVDEREWDLVLIIEIVLIVAGILILCWPRGI